MFIWDLTPERWPQSTFTAGFTKLLFLCWRDNFGIEATRYPSTLRSYMSLKCLILNVSFSLALFSPQISFSRYINLCMKDTDLPIENNMQPILVFQKKLEAKANVESSSSNLLLLRTTASERRFSSHFFPYEFSFICSLCFVWFIRNHEESGIQKV